MLGFAAYFAGSASKPRPLQAALASLPVRWGSRGYASRPMNRTIAALALLLSTCTSFAWHDTGHMVVAEIAYRHLQPWARAMADSLLNVGGDAKTRSFVTASCWADDYKSQRDGPWHYINIHFRTDGKPATMKPLAENVVWAIRRHTEILRDRNALALDRANALRYLIHFVGDIHQPMHCVARDTEQFPEGDRGGNDFRVVSPEHLDPKPRNLHFLWDMGGGLFRSVKRPLDAQGAATLSRLADQAMRAHPRSDFAKELAVTDPEAWAADGHDLAVRIAYDMRENSVPNERYLKRCRELSLERVALAGYRLAVLLNAKLK